MSKKEYEKPEFDFMKFESHDIMLISDTEIDEGSDVE